MDYESQDHIQMNITKNIKKKKVERKLVCWKKKLICSINYECVI